MNTTNQNDTTPRMVFKQEINENEYMRAVLFDLAANEKTPDDIFDAEFHRPVCDRVQAVAIGADVDLSYSVSIGYDRKEERRVYNKFSNRVETEYETVTDWHPLSGNYSCSVVGYAENKDNPNTYMSKYIELAYCTAKKESVCRYDGSEKTEAPLPLNQNAVNAAKNDACHKATLKCQKELPGNRHKDFKERSSVNYNSSASFTLPRYSVDYSYKSTRYKTTSFATGKYKSCGDFPACAETVQANVLHSLNYVTYGCIALSCLSFFTLFIHFALGLIVFLLNSAAIVYQNCFLPEIIERKCEQSRYKKQSGLKYQLEKLGLAPATNEEISFTFKYIETANNNKKNWAFPFLSGLFYFFAGMFTNMLIVVLLVACGIAGYKLYKKYRASKKNKS